MIAKKILETDHVVIKGQWDEIQSQQQCFEQL